MIGEASLLENLQSEGGLVHQLARSTIVAEPGAAFVRWPQRAFYDLQVPPRRDNLTLPLITPWLSLLLP